MAGENPDINISFKGARYKEISEVAQSPADEEDENLDQEVPRETLPDKEDRKFEVNTLRVKIGQKNSTNEIMSKSYKTRAKRHQYFAEQFLDRARFFEKHAKEHKMKSAMHQDATLSHERNASDFSRKSMEARKMADNFEAMATHFLSRSKFEMRSYALAKAEATDAFIVSKGLRAECADHYSWAAKLRAMAHNLRELSKVHKSLAKEAQDAAEEVKALSAQEGESSRVHLEKANLLESKQVQADIKGKGFLREYEDFLLKSAVQANFARQAKIRALYEDVLSKLYDLTSTEVGRVSRLEDYEAEALKWKIKDVEQEIQELDASYSDLKKENDDEEEYKFRKY